MVERLPLWPVLSACKKIEGFFPADFSQDGAFGPVAQAGFEQIADGDSRNLWSLLPACLKADKVGFADVNLCRVLNDQQSVFVGNEVGQDIE